MKTYIIPNNIWENFCDQHNDLWGHRLMRDYCKDVYGFIPAKYYSNNFDVICKILDSDKFTVFVIKYS